jgi:hypothetical protein
MARTTQWDEEYLKARADDARDAALARLCDHDRKRAAAYVQRLVSDAESGHQRCPDRRCRRARRCIEDAHLACSDLLRFDLPDHVAQELIEDRYAKIQMARKARATEK